MFVSRASPDDRCVTCEVTVNRKYYFGLEQEAGRQKMNPDLKAVVYFSFFLKDGSPSAMHSPHGTRMFQANATKTSI